MDPINKRIHSLYKKVIHHGLLNLADKPIPLPVCSREVLTSEMICSVCNGIIYRPRKYVFAGDPCTHRYCFVCMDLLSRNLNKNPIQHCLLCNTGYTDNPLQHPDLDQQGRLADIKAACPNVAFGCDQTLGKLKLGNLGEHLLKCGFFPARCAECESGGLSPNVIEAGKHNEPCTATCTCGRKVPLNDKNFHETVCISKSDAPLSTTPTSHPWETQLVDKKKCPVTVDLCMKEFDSKFSLYLTSLANATKICKESVGANPINPSQETLTDMSKLAATAISINQEAVKLKGGTHDANLHLKLGLVLEESFLATRLFPVPSVQKTIIATDNQAATEASMTDEFNGLLMQLGIPPNATNGAKMQAIEAEYHRLLGQNMSDQVLLSI